MWENQEARQEALKIPAITKHPELIDRFIRLIQPGNPHKLVLDSSWIFRKSVNAEKGPEEGDADGPASLD